MSKLIKNTFLYSLGKILPQAAGFVLLPIYSQYLTPNDYGIVSSMQVLSGILIVIFSLSLDRGIYRLYFDYKNEEAKRNYLGTITISLIVLSVVVLIVLFLLRGILSHIFKTIDFYPYYAYSILTAFLSVFSIVPFIYFQINEKAKYFVSISLLSFILSTGLVLWFVVKEHAGAIGMLKGQFLGQLILLPLFLYISTKIINISFSWKMLRDNLRFSLPMIPGLMSAWILNLSDRIFIEKYFNLHDVGIYSLGYKIAGLVLIVFSALTTAYTPVFYKLASSINQKEAKLKLTNYNNTIVIVIILGVFLISIFAKEAIGLFLDEKYYEAHKIVPIIAFSYLFSLATGLLNLMFYQEKKSVQLMYIIVGGAFLNILLNYILVPILGAYGAAFATVLSFCVMFFVELYFAKKYYYIPFAWRRILTILIPIIGMFFLFQINWELNLFMSLLVKTIVCGLIGAFFIKKYNPQLRSIIVKS